jgi:hypothetical protein
MQSINPGNLRGRFMQSINLGNFTTLSVSSKVKTKLRIVTNFVGFFYKNKHYRYGSYKNLKCPIFQNLAS